MMRERPMKSRTWRYRVPNMGAFFPVALENHCILTSINREPQFSAFYNTGTTTNPFFCAY